MHSRTNSKVTPQTPVSRLQAPHGAHSTADRHHSFHLPQPTTTSMGAHSSLQDHHHGKTMTLPGRQA